MRLALTHEQRYRMLAGSKTGLLLEEVENDGKSGLLITVKTALFEVVKINSKDHALACAFIPAEAVGDLMSVMLEFCTRYGIKPAFMEETKGPVN